MFNALSKFSHFSAHTSPLPIQLPFSPLTSPISCIAPFPLITEASQLKKRPNAKRYFGGIERYIRFGRISAQGVRSTFIPSVMQLECVFVTQDEHRKYNHYRHATSVPFSFLFSARHYALVSRHEQNMTVFSSWPEAAGPVFGHRHSGHGRRVLKGDYGSGPFPFSLFDTIF